MLATRSNWQHIADTYGTNRPLPAVEQLIEAAVLVALGHNPDDVFLRHGQTFPETLSQRAFSEAMTGTIVK